MADFDTAFQRMMIFEGWVLEDVPGDNGGETCCGITRKYNPAWPGWNVIEKQKLATGKADITARDLRQCVEQFYLGEWNILCLDAVRSQKIADQIFQAFINIGSRAVRWAQNLAGSVADGVMGPQTVGALNKCDDLTFCRDYADLQCKFYESIVERDPTQKKFLRGWLERAKYFA